MEEIKDYSQQLLNAKQVAERLNISKPMVYKLMQNGKIQCVRINSARRVRPEDLDEYIENNLSNRGVYRA